MTFHCGTIWLARALPWGALLSGHLVGCTPDARNGAHDASITDPMRADRDAAHDPAGAAPEGGPLDGSSSGDGGPDDAAIDAADAACARSFAAFESFRSAHASCERDEDCTVVGDCGPHANFSPVRIDAAEEAYELKQQVCDWAHDGIVPNAVCVDRTCVLGEGELGCCGCPPEHDAAVAAP